MTEYETHLSKTIFQSLFNKLGQEGDVSFQGQFIVVHKDQHLP